MLGALGVGTLGVGAAQAEPVQCPEVVGVLPYGTPHSVEISDQYALYGTTAGLAMLDLSDPATPLTVAGVSTLAPVLEVAVSGTEAMLATGETGVDLLDVSTPTEPWLVATR